METRKMGSNFDSVTDDRDTNKHSKRNLDFPLLLNKGKNNKKLQNQNQTNSTYRGSHYLGVYRTSTYRGVTLLRCLENHSIKKNPHYFFLVDLIYFYLFQPYNLIMQIFYLIVLVIWKNVCVYIQWYLSCWVYIYIHLYALQFSIM